MTRRSVTLPLAGLSVALLVAALVLPMTVGSGVDALVGPAQLVSFSAPFLFLGVLIQFRRPDHPVGPAFLGAAFSFGLQAFTTAYADAGITAHADLPAVLYAANVTQWVFVPGVLLGYTLPFLWLPNGPLLSRRWRWVARIAVGGAVVAVVGNALSSGELVNYPRSNPLAVDVPGLAGFTGLGMAAYVLALFAAIGSTILRYRRSNGLERLQMRWFMVGVAGTAVAFVAQLVLLVTTGDVGWGIDLLAVLPFCAGVAVLRYRLFDVDRVISRTVSYVIVTGVLVGTYIGVVALTTRLLPLSGSVGVAASTLAVAAAFNPLRRRVQATVDRRFNRARYDAARTVEAFAVRLRDEVDADVVRHDLLAVTAGAVQPASVSLWITTA